jgi:beta-lactamase regulating signal transducer with metallopeptidase domain
MTLLLDAALKGSILIIAAAAIAYLLRGKSAAARHAAWTAAVIGHLAIPAFAFVLPQWRLALLSKPAWMDTRVADVAPSAFTVDQSTPEPIAKKVDAPAVTPAPVAPPTTSTTSTSSTKPPASSRTWSSLSVVAVLWILGTAIVLMRLAIGTWKVGRLAKNGDRVDDGEWLSLTQRLANRLGITRPLTLLRGDKLAVPVTWGVVYPAVLLPHDSIEWPEARRRFVLVHEMAHVKRFDALTQLVAQIAIAIFWFDPLIWLAAHRMRVEREHACDDYVIRDGTKPSLYAGELLEMVQAIGSPRHENAAPAFAALAMARRSEFEGRMLAILDSRQDRHTLSRKSAIAATAALAILVLPLAALRPFEHNVAPAPISSSTTGRAKPDQPAGRTLLISSNACDSVMAASTRQSSDHIHIHSDDNDDPDDRVIEFLSTRSNGCEQAAIIGNAKFAADRLISLSDDAYIKLREMTPNIDRSITITRRPTGTMEFASKRNGAAVPFDDSMRAWLSRFIPEVLTEAAIAVPERVARDLARGGVPAVLARIDRISSTSSRRAHYEALLDERPLSEMEYALISRHVTRTLASSPTDLGAVLARIAAGPAAGTKGLGKAVARLGQAQETLSKALDHALDASRTSSDSASMLTQYGVSDDPDMMLLALQGAKDISDDTDKRTLLQTLAAGSLRRGNAQLRTAFFDVCDTFSSDTDLRVVLQAALPYGHSDPLVTSNVFRLVENRMSSDSDRRVVLVTAAQQKLIKTPKLRQEFMAAAKSMSSSSDYRVVMQAAFDQ